MELAQQRNAPSFPLVPLRFRRNWGVRKRGLFNLAMDVVDRVPKLRVAGAHVKEWLKNQIMENTNHAHEYGIDKPELTNWKWPDQIAGQQAFLWGRDGAALPCWHDGSLLIYN